MKNKMTFNEFVLNVAKDNTLTEMEKIQKIADKQLELQELGEYDDDLTYIDDNYVAVVYPWLDSSARFSVDPVQEYGKETFKKFCNEIINKMNTLLEREK